MKYSVEKKVVPSVYVLLRVLCRGSSLRSPFSSPPSSAQPVNPVAAGLLERTSDRRSLSLCALLFSLIFALFYVLHSPVYAHQADAHGNPQKAEIEAIVHAYIMDHPEIVRDALIALAQKEEKSKRVKRAKVLQESRKEIFGNSDDFVIGNLEGDVPIVLFFDYNCIYCRKSLPVIQKILASDPGVRLILKEFPLLGQDSIAVAKLAIASILQGKYQEYHHALLSSAERLDEKAALRIAGKLGLSIEQLQKDAQSRKTQEILDRTAHLAKELGLNGTPVFILEDEIYPGLLPLQDLTTAIAEARKRKAAEAK